MRCALFLVAGLAFAQTAQRYAVILPDQPLGLKFQSEAERATVPAVEYRRQIETMQARVRREIESRAIRVTGSASMVLNAIFIAGGPEDADAVKSIPGVIGVVPLRRRHRNLNRATQLVNAPAAWNSLGGPHNAGKGIKIAILDSGIDQTHPALQDPSLVAPSGYPICGGSDCAFTNSKVIVARSYVKMLAAGSDPKNPALDSRPDDDSARDRDGHGTAVAAVAAGNTANGAVAINGIAPKAFLGNYKVYGSPGVNDVTSDDVVIAALDDAMKDKMDVVSFSSGAPAFTAALDTGATCGQSAGTPCDPLASAFENAVKGGIVVVSAAGNDAQSGSSYPAFNVAESPGDAPDVIAVGASTNSHVFRETVSIPDAGASLQNILGEPGDANTFYPGAATRPMVEVPNACSTLPQGSLYGSLALIERSTCSYATQVKNVQNAGAAGAVLYMDVSGAPVPPMDTNDRNLIPFLVISNADGLAIKAFLDANPNHAATVDSAGEEQDDAAREDLLAAFSSRGPSSGDVLIKPDLVAPGTSIYTAAQNYDIAGGVYSSTRFAAADGTSFSTPMVAGAAALVKQQHPGYTPLQIKSALVNTAALKVTTDDSGAPIPVDVESYGAGLLDAGAALNASVAVAPAAISFGIVSALPKAKQVQITNLTAASMDITIVDFQSNIAGGGASISFNPSSVTLGAGASATVAVTISGATPKPGEYSTFVQIQGTGTTVRVPYMYIVPSNVPANLIELGSDFDGTVGIAQSPATLAVKLVDSFGAPISGATVTYTASPGASLQNVTRTNAYGIATAQATLGPKPGQYTFTASNAGMNLTFHATARVQPAITRIFNAANGDTTLVAAPGSMITLIGTGLCDFAGAAITARLPLAINSAFVSFDVPAANLSVPGHVSYVSTGQVNVQVPWELAGQTSAQVKVTVGRSPGQVVTLALMPFAPALYESSPGVAAAQDANFRAITSGNPAQRGKAIVLYANGLGAVENPPASGDPAPSVSTTTTQPVVLFDDQPGEISFSGLNPGIAGVYQINVTVPANLAPGMHQVTVSIGGKTSKASSIPVI